MSFPAHITNIYELLDQDGEVSTVRAIPAVKKESAPVKSSAPVKNTSTQQKSTQQSSSGRSSTSRRGDRQEGRGGFRQDDRQEGRGGFRSDRPRQDNSVQRDRMGAIVGEGGEETARQPVEFARRDRSYDSQQAREDGATHGGEQRRRGAPAGGFVGNRRVFDRKSGTGRGREEKKGGRGRGNWGANDGTDAIVVEEGVSAEGETVEAEPEKPHVETEEEKAEREDREKDARMMTLDDYLKAREEKRSTSTLATKAVEVRKANEGVDAAQQKKWGSFVEIKRDDAATSTETQSEKKEKKVKNTVRLDEIFNIKEQPRPRYDDDRRGGRGGRGERGSRGRGGSRGGNRSEQRGPRGQSSSGQGVDFSDPNSFPTLQ